MDSNSHQWMTKSQEKCWVYLEVVEVPAVTCWDVANITGSTSFHDMEMAANFPVSNSAIGCLNDPDKVHHNSSLCV